VFIPQPGQKLPAEPRHVVVVMTGARYVPAWDQPDKAKMDFFDIKGVVEALLGQLHVPEPSYAPLEDNPTYHPGKCAVVKSGETVLGVFGELHPLVKERYDLAAAPLLAADLDLEALQNLVPPYYTIKPVPVFPPVLEDIAVIVDEDLPAERVVVVIRQAGGKLLSDVRLFDIFRGEQIGAGKKSLAYNLTYQATDRTLTDSEAAKVRQRIVQALEKDIGAKLRS
jgi:phenylalanyl-tRNA synthetase beta chain